MTLNHEHRHKISESALTNEQIDALGWSSLHTGSLLIPYLKPDGSPETCKNGKPFTRERLSQKQIEELRRTKCNDPGKYRSPAKNGCRIYHSALAIAAGNYENRLRNPYIPLRITEGELKTESATAHDPERVTIGLGGVSSWRDRYDNENVSQPLVDFDEIPIDKREVRLCFDSDFQKRQVAAELQRQAEHYAGLGAKVLVEVLPNGLDGQRLGLDDVIHRHGRELFLQIAKIAREPFKYRRGRGGEIDRIWAFDPQPRDAHERNVYLSGMLGCKWRRSHDAKDHWQRWTSTHWEAVAGDDELAAKVEEFMELQGWQNRELATIRSLLAAFRRSIEPASDTAAAGLLPFRNGCLQICSGKLLPHDPANGNSWCLPYVYDAEASCRNTEEFLLDRLNDPANVAVFRAFARALLVGDRLKSFLEITGPSNTGKSVLGNLLVAMVGSSNTAAGTLQRLEDRAQRFETLKLRGRRLAIFSEAQDYCGPLQTLKALTGGDPIPAEVKGGKHLDFVFTGGVVLVGNGPVRASDPTGAVINRRRSLLVDKVVQSGDERPMLDSDGKGGWRGDLGSELPGLANWCLAMPADEAKAALARDIASLARAESELNALMATDPLAEWADGALIWDKNTQVRIGNADTDADAFAYANYNRWYRLEGRSHKSLALANFKSRLVDMLRDTLGLPLPAGRSNSGCYRERGIGSVIPHLRLRLSGEEGPGVIRHAFMARIGGTDTERIGNGKTPVGNGRNGCNEAEQFADKEKSSPVVLPLIGEENQKPVPTVPSVPQMGSCSSSSVPETPLSVPGGVRNVSEWVDAALDALRLAPHPTHTAEVWSWLNEQGDAPAISKTQTREALERLYQVDKASDQLGLEVA
jgi:phage/plasmid-associated DNA primase